MNNKQKSMDLMITGITDEVRLKFEDKNLLQFVMDELTKTHIGDDNLKMTTLLVCISALLKDPKLRTSIAIKGNSSEGKDNLIRAILKHMPNLASIFLTSATQATIEDDIKDKRIIAFSEVNANREAGANKFLIEVIKQKAEGGTNAVKKDKRTDNKTFRNEIGEQATILYGTTETNKDEEMGTRFIEGTIKTDYQRIKRVNDKTCDVFSDMDLLLQASSKEDSWLKSGIAAFYRNKKPINIVLPYAKFLKESIDGQDIFDHNSPRSQRDIKRLLALTCAMAYLFQLQRKKVEYKGNLFMISEVQDFINTLTYSTDFFNQSYSGLDERLTDVLKVMKELEKLQVGDECIARDKIQEKLDVSKNTIKNYCDVLSGEGLIEGSNGKTLNIERNVNFYNGNKIYYKIVQKEVKKPIIRVQLSKLKEFLENKMKTTPDPLLDTEDKEDTREKGINLEGIKTAESDIIEEKIDTKRASLNEIDPFLLTPSEKNSLNEDKNEKSKREEE